jgi:putative MFS transporter
MQKIEFSVSKRGTHPLPPVVTSDVSEVTGRGSYADLFRGIYFRRTVVLWGLWLSVSIVSYGIANWMPTIYRTVLGMSLQQALQFNFITLLGSIVGCLICALLVDKVGRKAWICGTLVVGTVALLFLALAQNVPQVAMLAAVTLVFGSIVSCVVILGTYTGENYPTPLRGSAVGVANAWQRLAAVAGPIAIGWMLQNIGLPGVYTMLAVSAALAAAICLFGGIETRGRKLEELSPWPIGRAVGRSSAAQPISDPV